MSTPMTKEREADISLLTTMEPHSVFDTDLLQAIADLTVELDRLRANEKLAAVAALDKVGQVCEKRQAEDMKNFVHYGEADAGTAGQLAAEIRALIPDAQKLLAAHDEKVVTAASLQGYQTAVRQIQAWLEGSDVAPPIPSLINALALTLQTVRQQERERCAVAAENHGALTGYLFGSQIAIAICALSDATEEDNGK